MKTNIIKIGNSKGIRLPKSVLDQCHIDNAVDLQIKNNNIILRPFSDNPRKNWDKHFKKLHENKEDKLIISDKIDIEYGNWEW